MNKINLEFAQQRENERFDQNMVSFIQNLKNVTLKYNDNSKTSENDNLIIEERI